MNQTSSIPFAEVGAQSAQSTFLVIANQPRELSPASNAEAADPPASPESIAKRWALRFQSTIGSKSSESLATLRSASPSDPNLSPKSSRNVVKLALHLSVSVQETNFGDRVILSGNCESLGMWMADKSPSLSTNADTFPVWSIDTCVELNPNLMPLEFKFAIVRNQTGFVVSLFYLLFAVLFHALISISTLCRIGKAS